MYFTETTAKCLRMIHSSERQWKNILYRDGMYLKFEVPNTKKKLIIGIF